jgi:hypothetical protein
MPTELFAVDVSDLSTSDNELRAAREAEGPSDLPIDAIAQSLSDWAEFDSSPIPNVIRHSLQSGCCYSKRLMVLQKSRRSIRLRIEEEQRSGMATADLEKELELKRMETRAFMTYLRSHAHVLP